MWPMGINKGGPYFPFCPGKATWDYEAAHLLKLIELSYYTSSLAYPGSIYEQPAWYIDIVSDFLPLYDQLREGQKAKMMWGSGDDKPKNANTAPRRAARPPIRRR